MTALTKFKFRVVASPANPATKWIELRHAVREAKERGAEFSIVGAEIEIAGDLPAELRARLPAELLWSYLGAEKTDIAEQRFADLIAVVPVQISDPAVLPSMFGDLAGADYVSVDIETGVPDRKPPPIVINKEGGVAAIQPKPDGAALDPLRSEIMTLQLCADGEHVFIVTGEALRQLLASRRLEEHRLVSHNALFETVFLQHQSGFMPARPIECTMQASGLVYGPPRSLANACAKAGIPAPPKTLGTSCWNAPRLSRGQVAYAASDAALACVLWPDLLDKLAETGRRAAYELQRNAIPAVAAMQLRGLGYRWRTHARQIAVWKEELAAAQKEYHAIAGTAPPSTPNEIRAWLQSILPASRLATWPRSETGLLSIEGKHLKRLTSVAAVKPVLAMVAMEKLLSSFGASLYEHVNRQTGRLHANYNISGAKSGRFTCSRPNLQQLPSNRAPEFRNCIVAAPGHLFVCGDWNQIELRAAAWLFKDPALTAVYEQGRDLHTETAALIAGIPIEKVTSQQRQGAKAVNFGAIYGIGARSLAWNAFATYGVDMGVAEARLALARFRQTYHVLHRGQERHFRLCQRRGYIDIGIGRRVWAKDEPGGHLSHPQCCNLPVQGLGADAMLRAIKLVHERLRGRDAGLVGSVHDELLIEAAEDCADPVAGILREAMVDAFAATFPGAPLDGVVEIGIGRTWKEAKT